MNNMRNEELKISNLNPPSEEDETEREAIELLQTQYNQIQHLKKQNENKTKTINIMKEQIKKLTEKLREYEIDYKNLRTVKGDYDALRNEKESLRAALYEKERLTEELQKEFFEINKKFSEMSNKINSQEDNSSKVKQLVDLVKEYSKEVNQLNVKNKMYEKELNKLNDDLYNTMNQLQQLQSENKKIIDETNDEINNANKNLELYATWIDSYLGVFFDSKIDIPELPNFLNKKIIFTSLKQSLINARQKIADSQNNYENQIKNLHNQQFENFNKIERLCKQTQVLKEDNICLQNNYSKIVNTNENSKSFLINNDIKFKSFKQYTINLITTLNNAIYKTKPDLKNFHYIDDNSFDDDHFENTFSNFEYNFKNLLSFFNL